MNDEFGFLKDVTNFCNHRPLLLLGLSITKGRVIECGSGYGSTPYLSRYCEANGREFKSYESNPDWAVKTGSRFVNFWKDEFIYQQCGLAFIDHAPGENRHVAVKKFMDLADVIVCHDTELNGAGDYKYEPVFDLFRYKIHFNRTGGGAGASMISNKIDLSVYKGYKIGEFEIE
jgi:hypothetical protein